MNTRFVRVLNPGTGPREVARKVAEKWERRGWARRVDEMMIERIDSEHLDQIRFSQIHYDRTARTGLAPLEAIRNLPVAGPADRLYIERRRRAA